MLKQTIFSCTRISLLVLSMYSSLFSRQLPLPEKFKDYAVSYFSVKQLDDFSCGYNVLFNAANLEHHAGFVNKFHDYTLFKKRGYEISKE